MKARVAIVMGAILVASLTRCLPHLPNFAPMTAMAIFGAAMLADRRLALVTPLVALFMSDLCIEGLHRLGLMASWGIYPGMWVVYATMLLITLLGFVLRRRQSVGMIAGTTLAGSVIFFIVTNFAVWAGSEVLYPHTLQGLVACYVAAIPFFGYALAGDAMYATALFGGFALATRYLPVPAAHAEAAAN